MTSFCEGRHLSGLTTWIHSFPFTPPTWAMFHFRDESHPDSLSIGQFPQPPGSFCFALFINKWKHRVSRGIHAVEDVGTPQVPWCAVVMATVIQRQPPQKGNISSNKGAYQRRSAWASRFHSLIFATKCSTDHNGAAKMVVYLHLQPIPAAITRCNLLSSAVLSWQVNLNYS